MLTAKSPFIISLGLVAFSLILSIVLHSLGMVWVTYTLVIIFLGGIMIVFVYASSMNRVFKLRIKAYKISIFTRALMILLITLPLELFGFGKRYCTPIWLNFCCTRGGVLCLIALLILITLFIVVKLVQLAEGPLKF